MRILIVDDEPASIETTTDDIVKLKHQVIHEENFKATLARLENEGDNIDVIILDWLIPLNDSFQSGSDFGKYISEKYPDYYLVLLTAHHREGLPEEVILKSGFHDYIQKSCNNFELQMVLLRAQRYVNIKRKNKKILDEKQKLLEKQTMGFFELGHMLDNEIDWGTENDIENDFIWQGPLMKNIIRYCHLYAKTDLPVLIAGETGTGKEKIARLISKYRFEGKQEIFVAVNSAALPSELIESELFGHERGAFTGAHKMREGAFERANGGVIFLDEIGDLSLNAQAKILRAIQENEIIRLGGINPIKIDVKLICATNKDLTKLIAKGKFREDLYYRIQCMFPRLPSLIERGPDEIKKISKYFHDDFIKQYNMEKKLSDDAFNLISNPSIYNWPGNVRELKNFIRQLLLLGPKGEIDSTKCSQFLSAWKDKHEFVLDSTEVEDGRPLLLHNNVDFDKYFTSFAFKNARISSYSNAISIIQDIIARTIEHVLLHQKQVEGSINTVGAIRLLLPNSECIGTTPAYALIKKLLKISNVPINWSDYDPVLKDVYDKAVRNRG